MSEILSTTTLRQGASAGNEITFTVVPTAAATRIGIDRDGDVCDPCTAPQPFIKPKLTIAKLALPSGGG